MEMNTNAHLANSGRNAVSHPPHLSGVALRGQHKGRGIGPKLAPERGEVVQGLKPAQLARAAGELGVGQPTDQEEGEDP